MRKNLRKIRKSKGYSQEALSIKANVSITNIYNIENYKKVVKKETLDSVLKHHKSINYCNKILNNDENNSEAQKIKESSLASLKELDLLTKDKMKNYTVKDLIEYC